jgi:hypothetical protein
MDGTDYNLQLQQAQAKAAAAFTAMAAQQKETTLILQAIGDPNPHRRQMLAMILANPDLQTQVEAAVAAWFRSKTPAPAVAPIAPAA